MRLRQVNTPASRAAWTEHFYGGELKVVNGEVETDNQNWITQLLQRGFRPIEEAEDTQNFGEVYQEKQPEPLGTQIAAQVENECDQQKIEELVEESREVEETKEEDTSATIKEDTPNSVEDVPSHDNMMQPNQEKDPFSLENLMGDALRVPKPRPPKRRMKKE